MTQDNVKYIFSLRVSICDFMKQNCGAMTINYQQLSDILISFFQIRPQHSDSKKRFGFQIYMQLLPLKKILLFRRGQQKFERIFKFGKTILFQKDLKKISKRRNSLQKKQWQSFYNNLYYDSVFPYSNLSMIKPNNSQLKTMQEAALIMNFQKQPKKVLKAICDDLGIKDKLKKSEIMKKMPQELLKLLLQNNDHEIFRKHKILKEIVRNFHEINNRAQQQQQKNMMTQMNQFMSQSVPPMMYLPYIQQMMPQNSQSPFPFANYPMNMNLNMGMFAQAQGMKSQFQPNFNITDFTTQFYQPQIDTTGLYSLCPCRSMAFKHKHPAPLQDLKCIDCDNLVHMQCLGITSDREKNTYECPQCVIQRMDPLHQVIKQMGRCIMTAEKIEGMKTNFILNQEEINLIQSQGHGIEVRCIRLDHKYMYEITWPDIGELSINNMRVLEFKPLVLNSSLKKRKDEKYYTNDLNLISPSVNVVHLKESMASSETKQQFKISEDCVYYFGVFLVKQLSPSDLIRQIKIDKDLYKSKDDSIAQIRTQCQSQNIDTNEREVTISSVTVSLKCQFDSTMIETPCRGRFCDHIQCLSLENMVHMTTSVIPRKWRCPICKQRTFTLMVDLYQKEIIDRYRKSGITVREITFDTDGNTFDEKQEKSRSQSEQDSNEIEQLGVQKQEIQQQNKLPPKQELIILDEEEIQEENNIAINTEKLQQENLKSQDQINEQELKQVQEMAPICENQAELSSNEHQSGSNQQNNINPIIQQQIDQALQTQENLIEQQQQGNHNLQMPQIPQFDLANLIPYNLMFQQQQQTFLRNQQKVAQQIKQKEDHKNFESINAIQQYVKLTKQRTKDYMERNDDFLIQKLSHIQQILAVTQQEIKSEYTFKSWRTDHQIKQDSIQNDIQSNHDSMQQQNEQQDVKDKQMNQSNKSKIGVKQKEKIVKVIKKQYQEFIRKNFGTIDNPILQQFQQKLATSIKSKSIYKISDSDNSQIQQQHALQKQKFLLDQLKQVNKIPESFQINQQNELPLNRLKQLQTQQPPEQQQIIRQLFNPSLQFQQSQSNMLPPPGINVLDLLQFQQMNQGKDHQTPNQQIPFTFTQQQNILQALTQQSKNNSNNNKNKKAGVSNDPICIDDD